MRTFMPIACIRRRRRTIFLVLAVFIFLLRYVNVLKGTSQIPLKVSNVPKVPHSFCTFQPLSPEEDVEERSLLDSLTWPKTPTLSARHPLKMTINPAHSTFTILPRRGGGQWRVGDQLEVMIKMSDFQDHPRKFGGDFLLARLHNMDLGAGVAGQVVDHLNGRYSAVFSLLWEGDAQVEVTLVHPGEAVTVLKRLNKDNPDRIYFQSVFRSGSIAETTNCNICLRQTQRPICNYTDLRTGEPWFCYKPKTLSCDNRINHFKGKYRFHMRPNDKNLFQSGVNMKVLIPASGPANVTVLPKEEGQPEVKISSVTSGPSGYYYYGMWRALNGTTVQQFNTSLAIRQCLKGKVVHMYGDSTIRQWFEFLNEALPDLKEFELHNLRRIGPFMALDYEKNIMVTFRCHGPPIRFTRVLTSELHYIANELDGVKGGHNTVVVLGIWAHFGTFPMEVYIRRLQNIRKAVVRLLDRAPGTLVVIRTANLQNLTLESAIINNDWYSLERDYVLRAMFKGLSVHLIDAWEMTLAHHLPHSLHPPTPIIKNMIDVLLSYICPPKGG
ncbi:NXPE family member 3-like [Plectropomus leopardus]|uniref:NXPE family member 3-like n=1 Tax=Plectropomus leopardus TaxID=160734 RepID=UPI001C4B4315|nr:NXPE family member 3-like [Plectropomus leopardus]